MSALSDLDHSDIDDVYSTSPPSAPRDGIMTARTPEYQADIETCRSESMSRSHINILERDAPENEALCCRLLDLAAELRNRIYEYAVIEDKTIEVDPKTRNHLVQPPLTRTNRQLRQEVLAMFYSQNTFEIKAEIRDLDFKASFYHSYLDDPNRARGYFDRYYKQKAHEVLTQAFAPSIEPRLTDALDITRAWLSAIGKENEKQIGAFVVAYSLEESLLARISIFNTNQRDQKERCLRAVKLMASTRYDQRLQRITETDAEPLMDGWGWSDEDKTEVNCNCDDQITTHCKLVMTAQ